MVKDLVRLADSTAQPPENPDAELIVLCKEFIELEQRQDELYEKNEDLDAIPHEVVDQIQAQQEALAEQIDGMSFKSMEGAQMIARAAARWAKDMIEDGFAELGGLHGDLYFTLVKGLIGENGA